MCQARACNESGIHLDANVSIMSFEPIEKRPIFHYHPNLMTLSVGGWGCNMKCDYCQNWEISQEIEEGLRKKPMDAFAEAISRNVTAVCFTYNEPIIYYEWIMEWARIRDEVLSEKQHVILKTNGFCEKGPWQDICEFADAMNIDWKGPEEWHQKITHVDGKVVMDRIEDALKSDVHVEISVPVYPGPHSDRYREFSKWLASMDSCVPVHLLKIVPAYKNLVPITSDTQIERVYDQMREDLEYVYIGNLFGRKSRYMTTVCHKCNNTIATRCGLVTDFVPCGCGTIIN